MLRSIITFMNPMAVQTAQEAFFEAVKSGGDVSQIQHLIEKGAKVEARTSHRETALYFAVRKGYVGVMKSLLRYGAKELSSETLGCFMSDKVALYNTAVASSRRGKFLGFALGRHHRVGVESPVKMLVDDVVGMIHNYLTNPRP